HGTAQRREATAEARGGPRGGSEDQAPGRQAGGADRARAHVQPQRDAGARSRGECSVACHQVGGHPPRPRTATRPRARDPPSLYSTRTGGILMERPREANREPTAPKPRQEGKKLRLQILKLEGRVAPRILTNHNETLVRDRAAWAR